MSGDRENNKFGEPDPNADFGLPKVEISPIPTSDSKIESAEVPSAIAEGEAAQKTLPAPSKAESEERRTEVGKKRSYGWLVLLLIFFVFVLGGWYYFSTPQGDGTVKDPEPKPVAEEPAPQVQEPEPEVILEEEVEEFTLTEITSRADRPRYFVVVGSFVDEDMAKDHSEELNAKGMNTFLVYPYGEIIYYRLAIGQYETFALALEEINRVKDGFKENLWALKY